VPREAFAALAMVRRNHGMEQESLERIGEKLEAERRRTPED